MNREKIDLLTVARQLIVDGHETYICLAIGTALYKIAEHSSDYATDYARYKQAADELKRYINRKLDKYNGTLQDWQRKQGCYVSVYQSRQDRLGWIDYMLGITPDRKLKRPRQPTLS